MVWRSAIPVYRMAQALTDACTASPTLKDVAITDAPPEPWVGRVVTRRTLVPVTGIDHPYLCRCGVRAIMREVVAWQGAHGQVLGHVNWCTQCYAVEYQGTARAPQAPGQEHTTLGAEDIISDWEAAQRGDGDLATVLEGGGTCMSTR